MYIQSVYKNAVFSDLIECKMFIPYNNANVVYELNNNSFINFKEEPKGEMIKGTKDVMVQKITGVIYNSFPIIFLSA